MTELEPPQPATAQELTHQAKELVSYFSKRFFDVENSYPNSKAISQAISLITQHGLDKARHVVDFAHSIAQETKFKIQTFGGIMDYTSRALADYEQAKRKKDAAARQREQERRKRSDEALQKQYEEYRSQELASLRSRPLPVSLLPLSKL